MSVSYAELLLLGTLAGFTIFLGLPLAFMPKVGNKTKSFLTVFSAGVLIFLLYEIIEEVLEEIGEHYAEVSQGTGSSGELVSLVAIFLVSVIVGLGGLVWFENRFINRDTSNLSSSWKSGYLALMIAIGIGLHNFGEGLAIGQAFIQGSLALAFTLIIGFGLHNATEGFGIVAPISGEKPKVSFLALLGLIGGGPTFLGTLVGSFYASKMLEIIFMSLAAGSILYVVIKLFQVQYKMKEYQAAIVGAIAGFFLAWVGEWVTKVSMRI